QPGPTTGEMLIDLLSRYPDGATVGELSDQLNRPVSMLLIVLKLLKSEGKVRTRLSESGMARVYFLR
ncbi:MAG: winged helix-turn-helix domain-containing protein, partial [Cyanobacteriota bacterium]|nr:winged helix-turn-helix domain-containing protein [Cyanobacteriota bacterium]